MTQACKEADKDAPVIMGSPTSPVWSTT
ncbi:hypothetical protein SY1_01120 [Fretibacterium fastidiosum]|uniref:Uncharacterized protein n=1 Tax=Fretibacterium fastidiosum TaxID=651822 RepID=A0AB94IV98_9BACT|nr:hypothetical protein SY1_01120 [Fretibacterium fastidiosum]